MSAGTKIMQLRTTLIRTLRYVRHLPDCHYDAGGTCRCGLLDVRRIAQHLAGADPARTGGSASLDVSPRPPKWLRGANE